VIFFNTELQYERGLEQHFITDESACGGYFARYWLGLDFCKKVDFIPKKVFRIFLTPI
jgi:hypothetical protein